MGKVLKSGFDWLVDFLVERWPYVAIGLVSLVMTWLASVAAFLKPYGAVAWGAVGLVSALVAAGVFLLWSVGRRYWVQARFEARRAETSAVNPLAGHFSKQRLRLMDFFHPFMQATVAAKFEDCELLGPAVIFLNGCTLFHPYLLNCEAVIAKQGAATVGAIAFQGCVFDRCKIYNATFIMTKDQYSHMKDSAGQGLRVISDGTAGDL